MGGGCQFMRVSFLVPILVEVHMMVSCGDQSILISHTCMEMKIRHKSCPKPQKMLATVALCSLFNDCITSCKSACM